MAIDRDSQRVTFATDMGIRDKRVLITGHRGFIGRHLIAELARRGAKILLCQGDVRDRGAWQPEFEIAYHLAAASPSQFESSPTEAFDVNINGVLRGIEACAGRNAHLIFASSCSVYACCDSRPVAEDHELAPTGSYATSKLIGEMLCRDYARNGRLGCTFFRPFNVYGPGQSSDFLIPYLIDCARKGIPASIRHPDSIRDFVHVRDVVAALIAGATRSVTCDVFNLGSGQGRSVRQVIDSLSKIFGRTVRFEVVPAPPDPIPSLYADISKSRLELGWAPQVSLDTGLRELVAEQTP
ncbi:MAG: NAD(P)-dependent oxidoreductase [Desulfomonile tiedjei]|nr:NAD(P)-dependent oxidoreductase [Desulfomonile tiedjei]